MASYSLQLECLACSNRRTFVHHSDAGQRMLNQTELTGLPRNAPMTCGRCGSTSLIRSWADATPFATAAYTGRRRRRSKEEMAAARAEAAAK